MRREWGPEELIAAWTLLDGDWERVGNKTGATRLGFGLMLTAMVLVVAPIAGRFSDRPPVHRGRSASHGGRPGLARCGGRRGHRGTSSCWRRWHSVASESP
ncbi:hypothetical protein GCM10010412_066640 [Nonomuraea recticatena]|uniref:Transposase n=1 Tax=Nonomuraea recticatena TaxID=46178 RepID=A0ABN3SP06_9ACTN